MMLFLLLTAGCVLLTAEATSPVVASACGDNETYAKCLTSCPPETCEAIGLVFPCPFQNASYCKPGCHCSKGYLRDEKSKCIKKEDCPCKGDPNSMYKDCPSACPATCANPVPSICTKQCARSGCECREGHVLNNSTGKCVKHDQCNKSCPKNEIFNECFWPCQNETCAAIGMIYHCPIMTPTNCIKGCRCAPGYLRNERGRCIKKEECPCNGDRNAEPGCSNWCGKSCTDYNSRPKPCPYFCLANGCQCKEGYVHDASQNRCVLPADCPKPCPVNEEFSSCFKACPPRKCSSIGKMYKCAGEQNCSKGCVCLNGYSRADNNTCIPSNECPEAVCSGPNETFANCAECSEAYCQVDDSPPAVCVAPTPCAPGCVCAQSYRRDNDNLCIPESDCPPIEGDSN